MTRPTCHPDTRSVPALAAGGRFPASTRSENKPALPNGRDGSLTPQPRTVPGGGGAADRRAAPSVLVSGLCRPGCSRADVGAEPLLLLLETPASRHLLSTGPGPTQRPSPGSRSSATELRPPLPSPPLAAHTAPSTALRVARPLRGAGTVSAPHPLRNLSSPGPARFRVPRPLTLCLRVSLRPGRLAVRFQREGYGVRATRSHCSEGAGFLGEKGNSQFIPGPRAPGP